MQPRDANPTSLANGNGGGYGVESSNHSRASSRNSNSHTGTNGVGRRNGPRTRTVWPNGPGVGFGGQYSSNMVVNDTVGPRLSNRRTSGTSSGSGSNGNRTPGDEASSTAVSHFARFFVLRNPFFFVVRSRIRSTWSIRFLFVLESC